MDLSKVKETEFNGEKVAVVPIDLWHEVLETLEELSDMCDYNDCRIDENREVISHEDLCCELGVCPLRYLRMQAGMTQSELARKSGFPVETIAKIEDNEAKPDYEQKKKLADALGVGEDKL